MAEFDPIPAFNEAVNFDEAYTRSCQQVFEFLTDAANHPDKYDIPTENRSRQKDLLSWITELCPGGTRYQTNGNQYIRAVRDSTPMILQRTELLLWLTKSQRYVVLFDLLGCFLSLMGPAPSQATEKNYFLPLASTYTVWCNLLVLEGASKFVPTVTQVTYATQAGKVWPFLGASTKGFNKNWAKTVQMERFSYVLRSGVLKELYDTFDHSPNLDKSKAGTRFSNCGETYPFLYILTDLNLRETAHGFALKVASVTQQGVTYDGQMLWEHRVTACDNYRYLITNFGGNLGNFF